MERPKKKTEKPSLAAQCRVLTEAAVLWALLAAGGAYAALYNSQFAGS